MQQYTEYKFILIRTTYKRTGGNTTNLHKHMQKKHSSKIETEVESGKMDKFVKKELPVNVFFLFLHFAFYAFNFYYLILMKKFSVILKEHFEILLPNGLFVMTNLLRLQKVNTLDFYFVYLTLLPKLHPQILYAAMLLINLMKKEIIYGRFYRYLIFVIIIYFIIYFNFINSY